MVLGLVNAPCFHGVIPAKAGISLRHKVGSRLGGDDAESSENDRVIKTAMHLTHAALDGYGMAPSRKSSHLAGVSTLT
jgi:hypothetical protein